MFNSILLNEEIKRSGLKRSYIAGLLGLSTYGFARKVDGIYDFKASEVKTLSEILNLTSELRDQIFFTD